MRKLFAIIILSISMPVVHAQFAPPPLSPIGKKIQQAVDSDIRTATEKERDANRKPRQTLEFLGLQEDMRVVELVPGRGWYTKIIAPVVADKGQYYVAIASRMSAMLEKYDALSKVEILPLDVKLLPQDIIGQFDLTEFTLGIDDVDLILTFRNLHNFLPQARGYINKAAFEALKPGGLYGVIDHTRRHSEPDTAENWRRMDPVLAILEIQAAGFELVDSSDLHYRPDDELRYEVGRKTVAGNTDRFTLLFRKPEKN
jgi:predicted methyltransferase